MTFVSSWAGKDHGLKQSFYSFNPIFNVSQKSLLTFAYKRYIHMHMRTTLNIDDEILEKASLLTGIKEKTALIHLGLEALIALESSKRLARLGGTEKEVQDIPRRRIA